MYDDPPCFCLFDESIHLFLFGILSFLSEKVSKAGSKIKLPGRQEQEAPRIEKKTPPGRTADFKKQKEAPGHKTRPGRLDPSKRS